MTRQPPGSSVPSEHSAGWHDVFALMRYGRMHIEGDLLPFMANLQFVKDLLAAPRSQE